MRAPRRRSLAKPARVVSPLQVIRPGIVIYDDKSFYFRGACGALKLRAYNLTVFLQLAYGVLDVAVLRQSAVIVEDKCR